MARKEFPRSVKVAAVKRATVNGEIFCEKCGVLTKGKFEIDHIKEDFYGGQPTLDNAKVLCVDCHKDKTSNNAKIIAKTRRLEAKHVGAAKPKTKIKNRKVQKKETKDKIPLPPRRGIYKQTDERGQEN